MRGLLQPWTRSSIIPISKRKISLEEQKAQRKDRFLRGRQIAYFIYDYFRVTGSHDSVENYADLFTIVLRNDDIQEFDSKCDGILLSMTKIPHNDILEGLYKLRIRESEKLKTVLELYDLEIHQKKLGPDDHRLKTMVKRSIEQDIRNKNFGIRNGNFEKNAVVKNQGTKQRVQRILGDCWQWEANGQCVKGDNCIAVSATIPISVEKLHHWIRLRILSCSRMSENFREPEVPEEEVPVVECLDGHARITSKELAKTHSMKIGTLYNAILQDQQWVYIWTKVLICTSSDWWTTYHELKRGPAGRRSSDARQLGCVFQDMKPSKSILRKSSDMQKPIQRVKSHEGSCTSH